MKGTPVNTNRRIHLLAAALALAGLSTLNSQLSTAFAQGSLTPPGAPGAPNTLMKTLNQIEARTSISSAPYTITNSGSYYLTTNLTVPSGNGITIAIGIGNVTLDLNGFSIVSTGSPANGSGIALGSGCRNITILNGNIGNNNRGFANGIIDTSLNLNSQSVRVSGILVNVMTNGIVLGQNSQVESCIVSAGYGQAIAASSVFRSQGWVDLGTGTGITAQFIARDCYGYSFLGTGLSAEMAQNCHGEVYSGSGVGLSAKLAIGCVGVGGTAIQATNATACYIPSGNDTQIIYRSCMLPTP